MNVLFIIIVTAGIAYLAYLRLFIRRSKHIHVLNVDEFEKQLSATDEALLIDVRTPREYKKYRIAGAKNIDYLSSGFRRRIKRLDQTKPVMVYCLSGYRSKMFCRHFVKRVSKPFTNSTRDLTDG